MRSTSARLLGRRDVAVGDDGDAHRRLDRAYRFVFHRADEGASARAAVHREGADAGLLGDSRDRERVPVLGIAPVRILSVTGTSTARTTAVDDRFDQRLVGEQCGAGGDVADLLRRAPHVDVDDLRAALDVVARGVGHLARIGAGDLHRDRLDLAAVIGSALRFLRAPRRGFDATISDTA
jgi:hypothetical protein